MTALILTPGNHHELKRALRQALPDFGSSHLSEALAAALGYRSNAALRVRLDACAADDLPEFVLLDEVSFKARLAELGCAREIEPDLFGWLDIPEEGTILVDTTPSSSFEIEYRSQRHKAWRNMMVAAINAGLDQKLYSLKPGENRWPRADGDPLGHRGHVYHFMFGANAPAVAYVGDAGWDELSFHVALWPTARGEELVVAANAGFHAGDAYAAGWLERKKGAWLQSSTDSFACRKVRLREIAEAKISPRGFGDRGRVIL